MKILFCSDPFNPKKVDPDFQKEYDSAKKAGFDILLVDFEQFKKPENCQNALRHILTSETKKEVLYRGYMLSLEAYFVLQAQLYYKNYILINDSKQYELCHHIPKYYPLIDKHTPRTSWINKSELGSIKDIKNLLSVFSGPIIIRDYLKSQKHYWEEACYIPDPSNTDHALKVIDRFLELQGESFEGGVVFREFVPLEKFENSEPTRKGQFSTKEYRLFYFKGKLVGKFEYWDLKSYGKEKIPLEKFNSIARKIESNFFTIDIAKTKSGEWIIIELGDGQVSGTPDNANTDELFSNIKKFVSNEK